MLPFCLIIESTNQQYFISCVIWLFSKMGCLKSKSASSERSRPKNDDTERAVSFITSNVQTKRTLEEIEEMRKSAKVTIILPSSKESSKGLSQVKT
jgi:hypothetical protein